MNQLYVYIYPHIPSLWRLPPTLPIPPLWVVTKHRADLPVLCSCFPLAIYFSLLHLVVYIFQCYSLTLSQLTIPPTLCLQVDSLGLHRYSCPAPRFIRTFFCFFYILYKYVLAYGICFSLSDLLHSV